jgi:inorganic pyrophosphatase/exopolyphosphatase
MKLQHLPSRIVEFGETLEERPGSCCSLIAREALGLLEGRSSASMALLGVILLDTVGLSETSGKTSPLDVAMASELAALMRLPSQDRGEL